MAILKNATPFDSVRGRFSGTDQIHFRNRKADNATIGVRMKNPYNGGNSTAQAAYRQAFQTAQTAVATAMATASTKAPYEAAYKAQKKYKTLRGYIFAQVFVKPTTTTTGGGGAA